MTGNIFDYIDWRGDLSFHQNALNAVDGLILSCITYINYPVNEEEELCLSEATDLWQRLPEEDQFKGIRLMKPCMELAKRMAESRRYNKTKVTRYVDILSETEEKQFSAMTFLLPGKKLFMAFRGTDDTLIGWKEDCNMAFINGTPAQLEAEAYAKKVAETYPDYALSLGGHSKGGNLAVWAGVHLAEPYRQQVKHIYNYDGPGFCDAMIQSEAYKSIQHKIFSFVPESSVFGVLMGCCDYLTIKSSNVSLLQHDPFSWEIIGNHFIYETERSKSGKLIAQKLNGIIRTMSEEELSEFVNDIYHIMSEGNIRTLNDLNKHWFKKVGRSLLRIKKFDRKIKASKGQNH